MVQSITVFLVFGLLPPAVLVAVISAIVEARQRAVEDEPPADPGIGTVRRLFIYGLALVSLIFAAIGLSMIIGGSLDALAGRLLISDQREALSIALAFVTVGTPAWLFFAWLAHGSLREHPVERRSQVRRLYLSLARVIAVAVVAANAITAGRIVAGLQPFSGSPWGYLVAWCAVWAVHTRAAMAEPPETVMTRLLERLTGYFSALLGLLLLLGGAVGVLASPFAEAYERAFRSSLVRSDWTQPLRSALVVFVVGLAVWCWHWARDLATRDRLTTLWRIEVFLFGALLGVVLAIVPAALLLYVTLEWILGSPVAETAAAQFSLVPGATATCIVGLASWGYHWALLADAGAVEDSSGPERVYRYLLSGAGLVTVAIGAATLIAVGSDAAGSVGQEFVHVDGWWRNPLLRAVTLFAVGLPLWLRYWAGSQQRILSGRDDRRAPSRRIYLFLAVGVAVLALLISLTILLYAIFRAILDGEIGLHLIRDSRWSIATVLTSVVVAAYHFMVQREDQAALPAEAPAQPAPAGREVLLVAPAADYVLAEALRGVAGVRVQWLQRLDVTGEPLPEERRQALLRAVAATDSPRLIVTVGLAGYEVVPYTRA